MSLVSAALWLCQGFSRSRRTGPFSVLQTAGGQPVLCNHMGLKSCQGHKMVLIAGENVVFREST